MFVRVTNSFWPEFDGLYTPKEGKAWDGVPQWLGPIDPEEEANQSLKVVESRRNGIWFRSEGHWRIGRRNHYFYISENTLGYPPATGEGFIWESAHAFYTRKGNADTAEQYCEKGHPKAAQIQVTWEYPFGHPERPK
jgi:hypothetical protein